VSQRKLEIWVGLFVSVAIVSFAVLAFSVSGLSLKGEGDNYYLEASFTNIGGLKPRAPVKLGGVVVGRVDSIYLDKENYTPVVKMSMLESQGFYPETSSMAILTSGLLGEQYIGLTPGFIDEGIDMLGDGDIVEDTKSALVLEDLIGQFIYSINKED